MDFKNVPNEYRPIPFWSWNEKLDTEETARQIGLMHEAKIGGFFMHARCGLKTEFMGKEWFDNVSSATEEAKKLKMDAWAYDENGWPSGFGGGKVNGKGEKYQQKYVRMEKGEKHTSRTICNIDGYHFYYEVNPFYVDTLDEEVTQDFITEIYEPYYKKYKNDIKGFFTDEPQVGRDNIPWSLKLPQEYKNAYNEDLLLHLMELFCPVGDFKVTRMRFWKLVCDLFSKNYMKKIGDWCRERNLEFTGHLLLEDRLDWQVSTNGAVMPHYEYFTIPGVDWLGRDIWDCYTAHQVGSAAQQLGKKRVLSESFALCGHNVSFEELRGIYEWQMVHGVNLMCQHLEGYSMRGTRKRDYPPAMYYQQPWWEEYGQFNESMSRIGMILAEGEADCDTLLIHPQTTAWTLYDNDKNEGLDELNQLFLNIIKTMEQKHILFHLGDETLMQRHARVDGNTLVVGKMRYSTVALEEGLELLDSTKALLDEFEKNGGKIVVPEELPSNDIIDNPNITYTKRKYKDFDVHYFVNTTTEKQKANIKSGSKYVDIISGELCAFCGEYEFLPYDSLVVIDDKLSEPICKEEKQLQPLIADGEWTVVSQTPNVITLDKCSYFFDDELVEEDGFVINIQDRACKLKRPVKIRQEFSVNTVFVPEELYLVVETPENFDITINGTPVKKGDVGYFVDKAFRKIPVNEYFGIGENSIVLETEFKQSNEVYENLEKAMLFETEKNKLSYDMEIEQIYLIGKFSVKLNGTIEPLKRNSIRYKGDFCIDKPVSSIELQNIEKQGFPFFAGKLTVEKNIFIDDINKELVFNKKGINAIRVRVNEKDVGKILWNPTTLDLSEYLKKGENIIQLTLINNLRNMMGPHHLKDGESYRVGPNAFFKERCVWSKTLLEWDDDYCFVEVGLV